MEPASVTTPVYNICYCKGKRVIKTAFNRMEHSGMSINLHLEQMHKKSLEFSRGDPFLFFSSYLHTYTLAYRDLLRGNKKHFSPGNAHNKKFSLSSSGCISLPPSGSHTTLYDPS